MNPGPRSIEFFGVEDAPVLDEGLFSDLPLPYATALREVSDQPDHYRCWVCANPVGFVFFDRGGLRWVPVWLAREGEGPVAVMCEDCAPMDVPAEPNPVAVVLRQHGASQREHGRGTGI